MKEYFIYEFKIGDENENIRIFKIAIEKVFASDTREEREQDAIKDALEMLYADAMFGSDLKIRYNMSITETRNLYILRETPTHPVFAARWELINTDTVSEKIKMIFNQLKHGTYHDPWGYKHKE